MQINLNIDPPPPPPPPQKMVISKQKKQENKKMSKRGMANEQYHNRSCHSF